ncbi:hypothetical protein SAMN05444483_102238 [Salegentibacter echinorum]|uniref:Uncharacterized protein n=1 Tax=Salegentibacter echinorum TaxID=1073325 RepID=A0A1M5E5B5_SALEC|nr:hypothetical protein [Salegentibacter echinorum]SHF74386.1 hypothetical protein SAMN05444483_102238 [Salegentibacter echinorum]
MSVFSENLIIAFFVAPLFFFIIAVAFRLLDNSSLLFLQKEILVTSSNVSMKCIKNEIQLTEDLTFRKKLRLALIYRKLHRSFLILTFLSLPLMMFGYYLM